MKAGGTTMIDFGIMATDRRARMWLAEISTADDGNYKRV